MIFSSQKKPRNQFQRQGKINTNQNKVQNPSEIAKCSKKIQGLLVTLILGALLAVKKKIQNLIFFFFFK